MFNKSNASKFLKLNINTKPDPPSSNSTTPQPNTPSVTLNHSTQTYTPTILPDTQYLDIFPSTEHLPPGPPQLNYVTGSNSHYISNLSLSTLPSVNGGNTTPYSPQLNNNYSSQSKSRTGGYHSSQSSSVGLGLSETALTPNVAATAVSPNNFFNTNDIDFSLDPIPTKQKSMEMDIVDASCKDKDERTEIKEEKDDELQSIKTSNQSHRDEIGYEESKEEEKTTEPVQIYNMLTDDDEDEEANGLEADDDDDDGDDGFVETEEQLLAKHGYVRGKKIATTLQGFIYELQSVQHGTKYVVKKTNKALHAAGMTIQNGKKYAVKEDVLNEKAILEIISRHHHAPAFMVKFVEFFESSTHYYLVMEHGGSDLFEFIIEAHQHIQDGKLSIKEWRKFIKYIFWQMCVLLLWLHNTGNACHLDVSLENILVQNAKFIDQGNGQLSISTNIQIKFCDFGLAEFYDIDETNYNSGFLSTKYCGKTNYKSPQVYERKGAFEARKADVWSLGVVLFCMAVGAPPYKKPSREDSCYWNFIRKGYIAQLLYQWKRHHYVTERMLSLMKAMLQQNEDQRYCMDQIIQHPWLKTYCQRYKVLIKHDLLVNIYKDKISKK